MYTCAEYDTGITSVPKVLSPATVSSLAEVDKNSGVPSEKVGYRKAV
jgi:hypothetical protein